MDTTTIEHPIKGDALKKVVELAKQAGFKVYGSGDRNYSRHVTYVFIVDGDKIGYSQADGFGSHGATFSTVNKPCKECGTGFRVSDEPIYEPTLEHIKQTFIDAPNWAKPSQRAAVRKYKNWEEHIKDKVTGKEYIEL